MQPVITQYIEIDSAKCGGKPCLTGTRIRVWDIYVASELRGENADQIVAHYPSLSLAQVHAALAFYWDNRDAIDEQMRQSDEFVDVARNAAGTGPLARKLSAIKSRDDSFSS